ncbi:MAG: hypothetical protein KAT71_05785 [Gammaproteobacteria bacterium]|nr:hypothetical protein [Gammaproteobacteria bacterium]
MGNSKSKLFAALAVVGASLFFCASVLAFHNLPAPQAPQGYTVFSAQSKDFLVTNDHLLTSMSNHQHHKGTTTKVLKSHLVFFDVDHKPSGVKELIIHTQDGQRIALLNKNKLAKLIQSNPQWLSDNSITFEGDADQYYYTVVNTLPNVWVGEVDGKIAYIGVPANPDINQ